MLHRPTSAPAWSPARLAERVGAWIVPSSGLLRYVLIAAVLCAIGCLYLWQVNDLSTLHENTLKLRAETSILEQQNVTLAEQLAQWNSPEYVDRRSTELGYVTASQRTIAAPADASSAVAAVPSAPAATR